MKKKGRFLVLGAAATGCLFGAYFLLRSHNENLEEGIAVTEAEAILDIDTDEIVSLSFQVGDTQAVFQYADGAWSLQGDETFPVEESSVTALLEELAALSAVRTLENAEDDSEYGMEDPQNVIAFTDSGGAERSVTIGDTNETTGDDYVMIDGDASVIYTVDSGLLSSISADLYDYAVSETLPDFMGADVEGVAVSGIQEGYEIYRAEDTWCVETEDGEIIHADKDAVNTAFSTLASSLEYADYVEHNCEDGSEYGLDDSAAVFTIYYKEETESETAAEEEAAEETEGEMTEEETADEAESGMAAEEETADEVESGMTAEEETADESESEIAAEEETADETESETESSSVKRALTFRVGGTDDYGNYYVQMEGSAEVHTIAASTLAPFLEVSADDWKEEETETETEADTEKE